MFQFKQLESGEPPDIEVTTDDKDAELLNMQEAFESAEADGAAFVAADRLAAATREDDGKFRFTIPGDEAGEVGELFAYHTPEMPQLEEFLEELNRKRLEASG